MADDYNEMTDEEREEERRRREEQEAADKAAAEEVYNNPAKEYFKSTPEEDRARTDAAEQHLQKEEAGALNAKAQQTTPSTPAAPTAQPDNHLKSVGDRASGGGIVVGTGARLADDRSWEKDYNAMLQRRAARRAGRKAAADERAALLASGKYFDDGRGNIKLKKEFREYKRVGNDGRRYYNETAVDDGSAQRAIQGASRTAYDKAMGQMVNLNRQEMDHAEMRKAMSGIQKSNGNIAIYKGLVTALDSLKNSAQEEDETVPFTDKDTKTIRVQLPNGGYEDRKVDPQWDYDQFGRVTGATKSPKKSGLKIKSGFVGRDTIAVLNSQLKELGDDRRITGIVARQKVNPMFPDKEAEPFFYIQGVRYDSDTGKSVPWGRTFNRRTAYELGKTSGKGAGYSEEYSDDNLISTWGDVFGVGKREEAEARAKNAGFEHKRMVDMEKLKTDRMKVIGDLTLGFLKQDASEKADAYILKGMPKEVWDALLAPKQVKDKDGNPVLDEMTQKPITESLSQKEVFQRLDAATDWAKQRYGKSGDIGSGEEMLNFIYSITGATPPADRRGNAVNAVSQPDADGYGTRPDGTPKGRGWFGELKLPNGGIATEYSITVGLDGKDVNLPTLVPTLTEDELSLMVNDIIPNNKDIPESIVNKAVAFARDRIAKGLSPFLEEGATPSAQTGAAKPSARDESPVVSSNPKEGDIRQVQGGKAIFRNGRWEMWRQ